MGMRPTKAVTLAHLHYLFLLPLHPLFAHFEVKVTVFPMIKNTRSSISPWNNVAQK